MTIQELNQLTGTTRLMRVENDKGTNEIWVPVTVQAVQCAYGRVYLTITPVNGEGQMKVRRERTKEIV